MYLSYIFYIYIYILSYLILFDLDFFIEFFLLIHIRRAISNMSDKIEVLWNYCVTCSRVWNPSSPLDTSHLRKIAKSIYKRRKIRGRKLLRYSIGWLGGVLWTPQFFVSRTIRRVALRGWIASPVQSSILMSIGPRAVVLGRQNKVICLWIYRLTSRCARGHTCYKSPGNRQSGSMVPLRVSGFPHRIAAAVPGSRKFRRIDLVQPPLRGRR